MTVKTEINCDLLAPVRTVAVGKNQSFDMLCTGKLGSNVLKE